MSLKTKIAQLKKLTPEFMEKEILKIVKQHEADLVDLNVQQMLSGIRADGSEIAPEYSPITVAYKKLRNQPSDRVTLKDSGDFQRYMFADVNHFPIIFDSQDWKTDRLVKKYGEQIFGLTEANKKEFSEHEIRNDVEALFKKLLRV